MRNIIIAVVITAGLTIPFSFMAGTFHYRSQLNDYEQLKVDYQTELDNVSWLTDQHQNEMEKRWAVQEENKKIKRERDYYLTIAGLREIELEDIKQNSITIIDGPQESTRSCGYFVFTNLTILGGRDSVQIKGIVENTDTVDYNSVSFEVSVFDTSGVVQGVLSFTVDSFKSSQKRAFKEEIYDVARKNVAGYKIDVAGKYAVNL